MCNLPLYAQMGSALSLCSRRWQFHRKEFRGGTPTEIFSERSYTMALGDLLAKIKGMLGGAKESAASTVNQAATKAASTASSTGDSAKAQANNAGDSAQSTASTLTNKAPDVVSKAPG